VVLQFAAAPSSTCRWIHEIMLTWINICLIHPLYKEANILVSIFIERNMPYLLKFEAHIYFMMKKREGAHGKNTMVYALELTSQPPAI
jgi:hypothetical protein